jgi:hypothetical protein
MNRDQEKKTMREKGFEVSSPVGIRSGDRLLLVIKKGPQGDTSGTLERERLNQRSEIFSME